MTYSENTKAFTQLKIKPAIQKKWIKHNSPKKRKCGVARKRCRRCGRIRANISKYGIKMCRQCFREKANSIGFKKFN